MANNVIVKLDSPQAKRVISRAELVAQKSMNFKIKKAIDYTAAAGFLKDIKTAISELTTQRLSMSKPLDESKKRIMDFFRKPLNFLSQAEFALKRGMNTFQREEEEKRKEKEAHLQEKNKKDKPHLPPPVVVSKVPKVEGISVKKVWKFKVVNEKLIPREYLILNERMLGDVARATKGTLAVPGIKFYSEDSISAGKK